MPSCFSAENSPRVSPDPCKEEGGKKLVKATGYAVVLVAVWVMVAAGEARSFCCFLGEMIIGCLRESEVFGWAHVCIRYTDFEDHLRVLQFWCNHITTLNIQQQWELIIRTLPVRRFGPQNGRSQPSVDHTAWRGQHAVEMVDMNLKKGIPQGFSPLLICIFRLGIS